MRIAYLTCVYPPYPGGIGIVAQGMANQMALRGYEVEVFVPRNAIWKSEIRNPKFETNSKFKIQNLRPLIRFGNAAFLPQLLWRLRGFDIVHILYPFYGAAELVPLLRKISRAKIIVHHTMDAVDTGWRGKIFKLHSKYVLPYIFSAADFVIVLSEDYYKNSELARLSFPKEKFGVVPNGVDTTLFQPMIQDSRSMIPTILFVGGLDRAHYFKGVEVLIEACRILRSRGVNFRCQIIGEGEMRKEYEEVAREVGLLNTPPLTPPRIVLRGGETNDSPLRFKEGIKGWFGVEGARRIESHSTYIQFLGLIPHNELPQYYQQAAVCVVPATESIECFSIVAAEAQACGIPAIVSNFPGVRVTIEDGKTGYVVRPGDAQDLANRVQELIENPKKASELGAAGRKRVEQLYAWPVVGDILEHIYEGLCN